MWAIPILHQPYYPLLQQVSHSDESTILKNQFESMHYQHTNIHTFCRLRQLFLQHYIVADHVYTSILNCRHWTVMLIYHLIYEIKALLLNVEKVSLSTTSVTLFTGLFAKLTTLSIAAKTYKVRWQVDRSSKLNHKRLHDFPVTIPTCYRDVYRVQQINLINVQQRKVNVIGHCTL